MSTCLTKAEFEAQFGALHDRIFRRFDDGVAFDNGFFPSGFVNPDWQVVLLCDRIGFAACDIEDGEERNPDFPNEYEILLDVLAGKGVQEVVVTSARTMTLEMSSFVCRPDIDTVREGFVACDVWCTELSIFDRTGLWGLFSHFDNYGVLGGAPEIMEPYIEKAGGLETIKHRFKAWAESQSEGEWLEPELRKIYDLAGWDDVTIARVT